MIKYNASSYDNFPYISQDSILFSPSIGDLDLDNDHEIIFSTKDQLKVLDLESRVGGQFSWSAYRSNNFRNGYFDVSELSLATKKDFTPKNFSLDNNFPNPFNLKTKITFFIPERENVSLVIYNVNGKIIKHLLNNVHLSGGRTVVWDGVNDMGENVSSGIYLYKIKSGDFVKTKKMILVK